MPICYVTCYFDINRSQWGNKFTRSFDDYVLYFKPFVKLFEKSNDDNDHMIVFIDDRYISKIHELISPYENHNITLIPINETFLKYNIHCWQYLDREREIMESDYFKSAVGDRIIFPECRYPKYTLINHSKIDFISYAMNMNLSSATYMCWVDFGFFSKEENIPENLLDINHFNVDKINYTLIHPIDERNDSDIFYNLRYAPERIGGFFFLGNRDKMYEYQTLYHQSLKEFREDYKICDDDQAVALYSYFKNPSLFSFNTREYGWHKVLVTNQKNNNNKKKVISFCLWGEEPKYVVGLIENIKLAKEYYPDWICYIYIHHKSFTNNVLQTKLGMFSNVNIIIKRGNIRSKRSMLWRLEPILDESVELFISRDVDTRILLREVMAVREWVKSGKKIHIMRDHPQHYNKILGGMYGVRTESFRKWDWTKLIENYYRIYGEEENDQHFLEKYLYHMTSLDVKMIHDEMKKYEGFKCLDFPTRYEQTLKFVGCYVYEDGRGDDVTELVLKNHITNNIPDRMSPWGGLSLDNKLRYLRDKISCIYVIHYTKLVERKAMMMEQLEKHLFDLFLPISWVDNFDREKVVTTFSENNISSIIHRTLTIGEIANMMAHKHALMCMQGQMNLVIEDDCIFKDNFIDHLYQMVLLLELRDDWDMCCLGGPIGLNTYPARALDKSVDLNFSSDTIEIFTPSSPAPCTVSAMLYHKRGATKVLQSKFIRDEPYQCPSDHAIWLANMEVGVNMKWVQPFLTFEGSKTNMFNTSFTERGF